MLTGAASECVNRPLFESGTDIELEGGTDNRTHLDIYEKKAHSVTVF